MTCLEAQNLLAGVLADVLTAAERSALESHLLSCPSCTAVGHRLKQAWVFLEGLQPPAVPMNLGQRLKSAATAKSAPEVAHDPPPPPVRLPRKAWVLLAVALLLAAAAYWWIPTRRPPPRSQPPKPEAPPVPWSHEGIGPMALTAVPGADLWTGPASRGALTASGILRLDEGLLWGSPPPGKDLRLQAAGWTLTITRGRFSVRVLGTAVVLSCHPKEGATEGLAVIESGASFVGPLPLEAGKDGASILLLPGRRPLGPLPLRSPYPGTEEASR